MPTVEEARIALKDARPDVRGAIVTCPVCDHTDRVYHRRIHHTMAKVLRALYRASAGYPIYVYKPEVLRQSGVTTRDEAMLRLWNLIEISKVDGLVGYWRVTPLGCAFVEGRVTVKEIAVVFRNEVVRFEGGDVTFADCEQSHFDLTAI